MIGRLLLAVLLLLPFQAEAVISVVGQSFTSAGTPPSVTLPTNVADDIIILFIESGNEAISVTTPGYTEVDTQATAGTGATPTTPATSLRLAVFWKRSNGSETNPITVADSGDHTLVNVLIVRGAITSGSPWDVTTNGVQATASTALSWQSSGMTYSSNGSTLTTTVDGAFILTAVANYTDIANAQLGAITCGTLNNLNEENDNNVTLAAGGGIATVSAFKPHPGVVVDLGSNNMTATMVTSTKYAMFIGALKPATGVPLFVGSTVGAGVGAVTNTVTNPVGLAANDIVICLVQTSNQSIAAPTGFTEIDNQSNMATGTAATAGALRLAIFYKRLTDAGANVTVASTTNHTAAQLFAFTNVIASGNPYDVEAVALQTTTNTAASWQSGGITYATSGTVTTTAANTLVLTIVGHAIDSTSTAQVSSETCGTLSNYVEFSQGDTSVGNGTGGGFGIAGGEKATAGTVVDTGSNNFTATLAATSTYAMAMIALKPPVTGITTQQKAGFFLLLK